MEYLPRVQVVHVNEEPGIVISVGHGTMNCLPTQSFEKSPSEAGFHFHNYVAS